MMGYMYNFREKTYEDVDLTDMDEWPAEQWEPYIPNEIAINLFRIHVRMGDHPGDAYIKTLEAVVGE